jgi:hypothetical protein
LRGEEMRKGEDVRSERRGLKSSEEKRREIKLESACMFKTKY